ncbi:MAG TPA: aa3-type cytochrome c oxidase subunit IV [Bauldia sp.]|nr:aa3-type cytochrome c oxidase subunit IV [Bauldia sp.]
MADHGAHGHEVSTAGHFTDEDFAAHRQTYEAFLRLAKWSVIGIVILLILMTYYLV